MTVVVNVYGWIESDSLTATTVSTSQASVVYGNAVTFTATVSCAKRYTAPTAGSVDFYDSTTGTDLGLGTFGGSTGTTSTWTLATGAKTFNATPGDTVTATYSPGAGYTGSSGTTTQVVTARAITVTAAAFNKGYDGSTDAGGTPTITPSLVAGDTAAFSERFGCKNAGSGMLMPSGSVYDGNYGNNYAVSYVSNSGSITPQPITVTAVAANKVYDGTTTTTATPTITGGGLVYGDTAAFTESFAGKNATAEAISVGGSVNDLNGGHNYSVTFGTPATGTITPLPLTVTATTTTKTYDGTATTAATPTVNGSVASGDSAVFVETFDTKNVGTEASLTLTASISDGNSGNNYSVTFGAPATGTITARPLTVAAVAATKTYDGTNTTVTMPMITGGSLASGDSAAFVETFFTKNVATSDDEPSVSGSVNDGNGGSNYAVMETSSLAGAINPAGLTITAATNTKICDGTTSAAATPTVSGLQGSDTVTGLAETYANANAGTGKTLNVTGYAVNDGNQGGNYTLTLASATGVIDPAQPFDPCTPGPLADGSLVLDCDGLSYVSGSDGVVTVAADAALSPTNGTGTLTGITAQATLGGVQGPLVDYGASGVTANTFYCLAAQVNAASLTAGRYDWQMTITENYSDNSQLTTTYNGQKDVLNWNQSPFGLGANWSLDDMDYLVPGTAGVSLVQGDGDMGYFSLNNGTYSSQPGPYKFMTLTGSTQSGFTLSGASGTLETFNGQGQLLTVTDNDGNTTSYSYNSGQLTSVTDGSHHTTTFGYSGGHLTTITDFAGRVTTLSYESGQLVSIAQPDPSTGLFGSGSPTTQFTYYTTSGLLESMTDADGNTTGYQYSSGMLSTIVHADETTEQYQSAEAAARRPPAVPRRPWPPAFRHVHRPVERYDHRHAGPAGPPDFRHQRPGADHGLRPGRQRAGDRNEPARPVRDPTGPAQRRPGRQLAGDHVSVQHRGGPHQRGSARRLRPELAVHGFDHRRRPLRCGDRVHRRAGRENQVHVRHGDGRRAERRAACGGNGEPHS